MNAGADLGFSRGGGGADFQEIPHSKIVYIGAKGAFRTVLGSFGQKSIS